MFGIDDMAAASLIGTGVSSIGALLGGGGSDQKPVQQYLVAPEYRQGMLDYWGAMMKGGGDFLAPELRTGQSTLGAMLAQRGIAPNSPLAGQLTANMTSDAVNKANANRFGQMMQMYGTAPATTSGFKGVGNWQDGLNPNSGSWTATGWKPNTGYTPPTWYQQGANRFGANIAAPTSNSPLGQRFGSGGF